MRMENFSCLKTLQVWYYTFPDTGSSTAAHRSQVNSSTVNMLNAFKFLLGGLPDLNRTIVCNMRAYFNQAIPFQDIDLFVKSARHTRYLITVLSVYFV